MQNFIFYKNLIDDSIALFAQKKKSEKYNFKPKEFH